MKSRRWLVRCFSFASTGAPRCITNSPLNQPARSQLGALGVGDHPQERHRRRVPAPDRRRSASVLVDGIDHQRRQIERCRHLARTTGRIIDNAARLRGLVDLLTTVWAPQGGGLVTLSSTRDRDAGSSRVRERMLDEGRPR
jgi:hypothetical protein